MLKRLAALGALVLAVAMTPPAHADTSNDSGVPVPLTTEPEGELAEANLLVQILIALGLDVEVLDVETDIDAELDAGVDADIQADVEA